MPDPGSMSASSFYSLLSADIDFFDSDLHVQNAEFSRNSSSERNVCMNLSCRRNRFH